MFNILLYVYNIGYKYLLFQVKDTCICMTVKKNLKFPFWTVKKNVKIPFWTSYISSVHMS